MGFTPFNAPIKEILVNVFRVIPHPVDCDEEQWTRQRSKKHCLRSVQS